MGGWDYKLRQKPEGNLEIQPVPEMPKPNRPVDDDTPSQPQQLMLY